MAPDFKRTFLAGFAVLFILLIAPYYLKLIGYGNEGGPSSSEPPLAGALPSVDLSSPPVANSVFNNNNINPLSPTLSSLENAVYINILSETYQTTISNIGGGSFAEYKLIKNKNQYRGGYDDFGIYNDSISVSLILNNQAVCAPCVGLQQDNQETLLNVPFEVTGVTINGIETSMKQIHLNEADTCVVTMELKYSNYSIIKQTSFYGNSYVSNHSVSSSNTNNIQSVYLLWDKGIRNTEKNIKDEITAFSAGYVSINKEIEDLWFTPSSVGEEAETLSFVGNIDWTAIRNKYFIMAMIPEVASSVSLGASGSLLNEKSVVPAYNSKLMATGGHLNSDLYLGPLDIDYINALDTSLDRIMNFGWFVIQPFSRGVLWLLKLMHSFGLNYGLVLILFAFLIRLITGPLTKKSFQSSLKMQTVQPQLKKLQEKHKNNSQRLNQEMVKLYKEGGVNPLGGCLPMLLQMPLLFSLFLVFRSTIEFRGAPFFWWISNLSQPDTIFNLPFSIPVYGNQVAFLPILLGVSMFLTQKISMAAMDAKQKPMMYIMTAFFFLIFNSFPSGLNLYYLVYNVLNYFQQKSLKKA